MYWKSFFPFGVEVWCGHIASAWPVSEVRMQNMPILFTDDSHWCHKWSTNEGACNAHYPLFCLQKPFVCKVCGEGDQNGIKQQMFQIVFWHLRTHMICALGVKHTRGCWMRPRNSTHIWPSSWGMRLKHLHPVIFWGTDLSHGDHRSLHPQLPAQVIWWICLWHLLVQSRACC